MKVDEDLHKIVFEELGKKSADLFVEFYSDSPLEEQLDAARNILTVIVGYPRTIVLLKKFDDQK